MSRFFSYFCNKIANLSKMETIILKTNVACGACVAKITPFLQEEKRITSWEVNTQNPQKLLTAQGNQLTAEIVIAALAKAGYKGEKA